ncbi:hypothetical protein HanIR_Chr14g0720461 [Helianthus annuus]|nr:hypothetical protein HanIR_Chr14g0720461 [Helianthus annuus]
MLFYDPFNLFSYTNNQIPYLFCIFLSKSYTSLYSQLKEHIQAKHPDSIVFFCLLCFLLKPRQQLSTIFMPASFESE